MATVMIMIARPWTTQRKPTVRAVRHCGRSSSGMSSESSIALGSRGKKTRKRRSLSDMLVLYVHSPFLTEGAYITVKQDHCTPTWAIPRSPAKHSNELTVLQHATSACEAGKVRIFAKPQVPEVVPRRMK